jgi:hypothetical protein
MKKYIACESDVVTADEGDRDAIMQIWQSCFGDDEGYIDFYLKNRFTVENMLVIHRDGRPVSMASFLPAKLNVGGENAAAYYVYAVATLPEYRNQGLSTQILSYAKETFKAPLILQVENGSKELEQFYEKQGFYQAFEKIERYEIEAVPSDDFELEEITPSAYRKIRDAHFAKEGYVAWDEEAIAYALSENRLCKGEAYKVKGREKEDILLVRDDGDDLRIIETTLSDDELSQVIHADACYYENGGGMLWLSEDRERIPLCGYLNLTLG